MKSSPKEKKEEALKALSSLGIGQADFKQQIALERTVRDRIIQASRAQYLEVRRSYSATIKALRKAEELLDPVLVAGRIAQCLDLSESRNRSLSAALGVGALHGIPDCRKKIRIAIEAAEGYLTRLEEDLGSQWRLSGQVKACMAAAKIYELSKSSGSRRIGYEGALCVHGLAMIPTRP